MIRQARISQIARGDSSRRHCWRALALEQFGSIDCANAEVAIKKRNATANNLAPLRLCGKNTKPYFAAKHIRFGLS